MYIRLARRNKKVFKYPWPDSLLVPVSIRGLSTSTRDRAGSDFDVFPLAEVPDAITSCLANKRCKSSFSASPWHSSDSSLDQVNVRFTGTTCGA